MEQWYCSARLFRALKLPTPRPGPLTPLPLPHTPTHPHPTPTPAPQVWQRRQPGRLGDHQELPVACRRPVLPRAVQPGALGGTGAAAGAGGVWCGRVVRGARAHWTGQNAGRVPLLRRRPQRRCWIYELHLTLIRSRQRTDGTGPPLTPPPPPPPPCSPTCTVWTTPSAPASTHPSSTAARSAECSRQVGWGAPAAWAGCPCPLPSTPAFQGPPCPPHSRP